MKNRIVRALAALVLSCLTLAGCNNSPGGPPKKKETRGTVAFESQPQNGVTGSPIPAFTAVVLENGNAVRGLALDLTVELVDNPGNANLTGTVTVKTTDGRATFSNVVVSAVGNGFSIRVKGSDVTASQKSSLFNVTQGTNPNPNAVAALAFTVPSKLSGQRGENLGPVEVVTRDSSGNTTTAGVGMQIEFVLVYMSDGRAVLGGPARATVGPTGSATLANLSIDRDGSYSIGARSTGFFTEFPLPPQRITIGGGPVTPPTVTIPTRAGFTIQPPSTAFQAGTTFTARVNVQDSAGNTVTTVTGSVEVALRDAQGATLGGTKIRPLVNGQATFDDLFVSSTNAVSGLSLSATATLSPSGTTLTGNPSSPFNVTVGSNPNPVSLLISNAVSIGQYFKFAWATQSNGTIRLNIWYGREPIRATTTPAAGRIYTDLDSPTLATSNELFDGVDTDGQGKTFFREEREFPAGTTTMTFQTTYFGDRNNLGNAQTWALIAVGDAMRISTTMNDVAARINLSGPVATSSVTVLQPRS